ncbi:MAG: VCBS repeat-containing protein [Deltaproteobacteria bacterium]|nr:VCBS repeat-containing protein [Deltaproteobacteria bacterium]
MRAITLLTLLGVGCNDYEINPKDDVTPGGLDSEPVECPPQIPDCNDTEEDSELPPDSVPPDNDVCDEFTVPGEALAQVEECYVPVSTGTFTPVVEWKKSTWTTDSSSNNIMMMPAVASLNDDNGDGLINTDDIPDIIVITYGGNGTLRAVSGDGSSEIFNVVGANLQGQGAVAVGDIDNDGIVEIIAPTSNGVKAFENDGTLKWTSASLSGHIYGTSDAPAISDMDGDGDPEIIMGKAILNSDGSLRGAGAYGKGGVPSNVGTTSFAVDLDLDGTQELVVGNALYDPDGATIWSNGEQDGYVAVGNFDTDPEGEIVVNTGGNVRLQDTDGTVLWRASMSGSGGSYGGPPTVADFDGDGLPEVGVAGPVNYTVFDTDGKKMWEKKTQDASSGNTGSSVFDFEGDGIAEAVYADETRLWVFNGPDGAVKLESTEHSNATWTEYPAIADVDNDGHAEIVVANTNYTGHTGFYVFGDADSSWQQGRKIWNQHAYHITNVNDDGTIPAVADINWATYNNFRSGDLTAGSGGVFSDLIGTIEEVCEALCDQGRLFVYVRVGNQGYQDIEDEVELTLYADTPEGEKRMTSLVITSGIPAGQMLDSVVFEVSGIEDWDIRDLILKVDGGNESEDSVETECDETNNEARWGAMVCFE